MGGPRNRKERRIATPSSSSASTSAAADEIPLALPPTTSQQKKGKTLIEIAAERQALLSGGQPFSSSGGKDAQGRQSSSPFTLAPEGTQVVQIGPDGSLRDMEEEDEGPEKGSRKDYKNNQTTSSNNGATAFKAENDDDDDDDDDDAEPPPILSTIFLAIPLTSVHLTLSILAAHQYLQNYTIAPLVASSAFLTFPLLTFLIHLVHGHIGFLSPQSTVSISRLIDRFHVSDIVWCVVANVAGAYLISVTNDRGYYAVMRRAPSIGTVWVWAVIEMGVWGSVLGVLGPACWAWWMGYGLFDIESIYLGRHIRLGD